MKFQIAAALIGTAAFAGTATAATSYTVDKVTIQGSKTVPTADLLAAIQEHRGSKVTTADILADQHVIEQMLQKANVVGGIKTSMVSHPGNHIDVIFALNDQGTQAPVVTKVAPKLHVETFIGNASVPTDTLRTAAGLAPGEDLSNEKLAAAQKAIVAAYSAAKLPVSVSVASDFKTVSATAVDVVWTVTETKAKKKRRNTDDDGVKSE